MAEQALAGPASARRPTATEPGALPAAVQDGFRVQFGEDLRGVRVHQDQGAAVLTRAAHAEAVAIGDQIAVAPGAYAPHTRWGQRLLAHEAAHAAQARRETGGPPVLARRMIVGGAPGDVDALLSLLETSSGLILDWDPGSGEVTVVGSAEPLPVPTTSESAALAALLMEVAGHTTQDAELWVGQDEPGVHQGGFPEPHDFTGGSVQVLDVDDLLTTEAGVPGLGAAKAAHEIAENFRAHAAPPVPGVDAFQPAHDVAVEAESDVAEELVGPGRRVVSGLAFTEGDTVLMLTDYETYYLVEIVRHEPVDADPAPVDEFGLPGHSPTLPSIKIERAERVARLPVATYTIDGFAFGDAAVPSAGAQTIGLVAQRVNQNRYATLRLEGHTDSVGSEASNAALALRRAEAVQAKLKEAKVSPERVHRVGVGEAGAVADNDTEAGRAQNRRVTIEVARPDYP